MAIHPRQGFPAWWPLACVMTLTLALAPGCSERPEPKDELQQVVDSRGIMSYRYVPIASSASKASTPKASTPKASILSVSSPTQRQQVDADYRQQQQDARSYQDVKREIDDQRRQRQQEEQAHQETLRQNQQEQRRQQEEQRQAYQQQQSQWAAQQRQRREAETAQWQRTAQEFDASLRRQQQEQLQQQFPFQNPVHRR
jgi:hypothetical protein